MKAIDFVDIDNDTSAFNEWFTSCEKILACDINEQGDDNSNPISTNISRTKEKMIFSYFITNKEAHFLKFNFIL
jgi:hypothetical protein